MKLEEGRGGKEKNAKEGKKEVGEENGSSKGRDREGRKGEMKRIRECRKERGLEEEGW